MNPPGIHLPLPFLRVSEGQKGKRDRSQGSVALEDKEISYPTSSVQIPWASGVSSKQPREILAEQTHHSGLQGPNEKGCDLLGPLAALSLP